MAEPAMMLALSPRETARAVGIRAAEVYAALKAGDLVSYRKGSKSKILVSDTERWIRSTWPQSTKRKVPTDA